MQIYQFQDFNATGIEVAPFETACGIGIEITQEEIENAVAKVVEENRSKIIEQR